MLSRLEVSSRPKLRPLPKNLQTLRSVMTCLKRSTRSLITETFVLPPLRFLLSRDSLIVVTDPLLHVSHRYSESIAWSNASKCTSPRMRRSSMTDELAISTEEELGEQSRDRLIWFVHLCLASCLPRHSLFANSKMIACLVERIRR